MSQTPLPEQFDIERRTTPLKRTAERDEMAEYLEDHWNSGKTITEIAELSGYSRQHAVNTIESHFRKVENDQAGNDITITIPNDVDASSYLRGVVDSLEKAN